MLSRPLPPVQRCAVFKEGHANNARLLRRCCAPFSAAEQCRFALPRTPAAAVSVAPFIKKDTANNVVGLRATAKDGTEFLVVVDVKNPSRLLLRPKNDPQRLYALETRREKVRCGSGVCGPASWGDVLG